MSCTAVTDHIPLRETYRRDEEWSHSREHCDLLETRLNPELSEGSHRGKEDDPGTNELYSHVNISTSVLGCDGATLKAGCRHKNYLVTVGQRSWFGLSWSSKCSIPSL